MKIFHAVCAFSSHTLKADLKLDQLTFFFVAAGLTFHSLFFNPVREWPLNCCC